MTPSELCKHLQSIVEHNVKHAVMIWGPPGVGKSSIVSQLCENNNIGFVDVRLSQLMPSDLRGLPSPEKGVTHWNPPAFLPNEGCGVLFMDELNMAPPALQGVAQQLILDRKVGDYVLPEGWLVWAAGNRNTDRAAVYEMPGPLANRFLHFEVAPSLADFKQFAYANNVCETIIGFLSYRPDLLHKMHPSDPAWPSPRTWEMASNLVRSGISTESAVGAGPAEEYRAFVQLRDLLPNIDAILNDSKSEPFPADPSVRYATIAALIARVKKSEEAVAAFQWLVRVADEEWVHLFASDLFPRLRAIRQYQGFASRVVADSTTKRFLADFVTLVS